MLSGLFGATISLATNSAAPVCWLHPLEGDLHDPLDDQLSLCSKPLVLGVHCNDEQLRHELGQLGLDRDGAVGVREHEVGPELIMQIVVWIVFVEVVESLLDRRIELRFEAVDAGGETEGRAEQCDDLTDLALGRNACERFQLVAEAADAFAFCQSIIAVV